jgi:hypothetical protein
MTENALTIKDIDNLPIDQIAAEFGFNDEGVASTPGFPRLTINSKARNSAGQKVPDGTVKVAHPEHGIIYADDASLRILQQRFFYQKYDENATWQDKDGNDQKGRYVNRSIYVPNPYDEALDEQGGVNCGKFKVDDWDSLSEERKNEWRAAKRYRVIFGLLTVKDAFAEGKKDKVSFEELPVIFQISNKDTFRNFGQITSQMIKDKVMPWKQLLKLNFNFETNDSITWYTISPTILGEQTEIKPEYLEVNKAFGEHIQAYNESIRAKAYEQKRYAKDVGGVGDSDFIDVEALPE